MQLTDYAVNSLQRGSFSFFLIYVYKRLSDSIITEKFTERAILTKFELLIFFMCIIKYSIQEFTKNLIYAHAKPYKM